jgi:hypothetical protein
MELALKRHKAGDSAPHPNESFVSNFNYFFAKLVEDILELETASTGYNSVALPEVIQIEGGPLSVTPRQGDPSGPVLLQG